MKKKLRDTCLARKGAVYAVLVLVPLASGLALSGCATSKGYTRATETTARVDDLHAELDLLKIQIDTTAGALKGLVDGQDQDLRPLFTGFVKQVDKLEAGTERVEASADRMRAQGETYYTAWELELESISDPGLRKESEERRDQARERFRALVSTVKEARAAFEPYLTDLRDIQVFLNNDLNPSGVTAISDDAEKATERGEGLRVHIDEVIAELEEVTAAMSPVPIAIEEPPAEEAKG